MGSSTSGRQGMTTRLARPSLSRRKLVLGIEAQNLRDFALMFKLELRLSAQGELDWQTQIYNAVRAKEQELVEAENREAVMQYQGSLGDYYRALKDLEGTAVNELLQGESSAANHRTVDLEMRRHCLAEMTMEFDADTSNDTLRELETVGEWQVGIEFQKMRIEETPTDDGDDEVVTTFGWKPDPHTARYPATKLPEARRKGHVVQFLEQAFDWDNLSYLFYPYFWSTPPKWIELMSRADDADAVYTAFLQAGAARVLVSVTPGYEHAVMHYLATGQPWDGGRRARDRRPALRSHLPGAAQPAGQPRRRDSGRGAVVARASDLAHVPGRRRPAAHLPAGHQRRLAMALETGLDYDPGPSEGKDPGSFLAIVPDPGDTARGFEEREEGEEPPPASELLELWLDEAFARGYDRYVERLGPLLGVNAVDGDVPEAQQSRFPSLVIEPTADWRQTGTEAVASEPNPEQAVDVEEVVFDSSLLARLLELYVLDGWRPMVEIGQQLDAKLKKLKKLREPRSGGFPADVSEIDKLAPYEPAAWLFRLARNAVGLVVRDELGMIEPLAGMRLEAQVGQARQRFAELADPLEWTELEVVPARMQKNADTFTEAVKRWQLKDQDLARTFTKALREAVACRRQLDLTLRELSRFETHVQRSVTMRKSTEKGEGFASAVAGGRATLEDAVKQARALAKAAKEQLRTVLAAPAAHLSLAQGELPDGGHGGRPPYRDRAHPNRAEVADRQGQGGGALHDAASPRHRPRKTGAVGRGPASPRPAAARGRERDGAARGRGVVEGQLDLVPAGEREDAA